MSLAYRKKIYKEIICEKISHELGRIRTHEIKNLHIYIISKVMYNKYNLVNDKMNQLEHNPVKDLDTLNSKIIDQYNYLITNTYSNTGTINKIKHIKDISPSQKRFIVVDEDDPKNPQLIFIVELEINKNQVFHQQAEKDINNTLIIWNICKSKNPLYKYVKVNKLIQIYVESLFTNKSTNIIDRFWVALDFKNPDYEKLLETFLRAKFSIKGVTALPGTTHHNYQLDKRYLIMESVYNKYINYKNVSKLEDLKQLKTIGFNIRQLENSMKKTDYFIRLASGNLASVYENVISRNGEISGGARIEVYRTNISLYIENGLDRNLIQDSTFTEKHKDKSNICSIKTDLHRINFHTHPYTCAVAGGYDGELRSFEPPSTGDLKFIIHNDFYVNYLFHLIFATNCIYLIQLHPFWKYYITSNKHDLNLYYYLKFILSNFKYKKLDPVFEKSRLTTLKGINEHLFILNNNTTINEMSKNIDHTKFTEYKGSKMTSEEIRKELKEQYFTNNVIRNINMWFVTTIPYPINVKVDPKMPKDSSGTNYDMSEFNKYIDNIFKKYNYDSKKVLEHLHVNKDLFNKDISIPYYSIDDSIIENIIN